MKAFIFDLDGVLVFTDRFHYQAWKKMADRIGVYFDETINNRLRGVSRAESLEIILERWEGAPLSQVEKDALMTEKNDSYRELLKNMTPADVAEDVRKTLDELKARGHKLAIGSSSKNTKFILAQVGLEGFFDAISDGTNITRSKPDPEVFLKAAELLRRAPEECLVVEDARAGVEAARRGGFACAAIGDAKGDPRAQYHLEKLSDLLNL